MRASADHPMRRHTKSRPRPLPELQDPLGSVSVSALPGLSGASIPSGKERPLFCSAHGLVNRHSAVVLHLLHGAPGVPP